MTRVSILLVCAGVLGLLLGLPLVLVTADIEAPTPDIHALDCYARAKQGTLLDDRERWHADDAREQWQAEQAQERLVLGCWAKPPFKCGEDCR